MGLFDNKELAQQQAKASADKAYEMLKTMNSMFMNVEVKLIDRGTGTYCIEVYKGMCKEWHTILLKVIKQMKWNIKLKIYCNLNTLKE